MKKCKYCNELIEDREGYNYCDNCWNLKIQGKIEEIKPKEQEK